MNRAVQPVSIGGIEVDALIDQENSYSSTIPEYPVESGFTISDDIILKPDTISMTVYVTNTPVTWADRHGVYKPKQNLYSVNPMRVSDTVKKIENLYYSSSIISIVTSERTYSGYAIETLSISKSISEGTSREIKLGFKKINVVSTTTNTLPADYGKSGDTLADEGTASTESGDSDNGSILYSLSDTDSEYWYTTYKVDSRSKTAVLVKKSSVTGQTVTAGGRQREKNITGTAIYVLTE